MWVNFVWKLLFECHYISDYWNINARTKLRFVKLTVIYTHTHSHSHKPTYTHTLIVQVSTDGETPFRHISIDRSLRLGFSYTLDGNGCLYIALFQDTVDLSVTELTDS